MNRIILFAALVAAPSLAPASAQSPNAAGPSAIVSHADLDLANAADIRTLERRIDHAVRQVCGPMSSADPEGRNAVRRCRAETRAQAVADRDLAIIAARRPVRTALSD